MLGTATLAMAPNHIRTNENGFHSKHMQSTML